VGGSGFLAAFAAGLAIAALDVELCDCFLEYGEATAEMLLLLTFVAFGASLIWTGVLVASPATLAFTAVALLARTAVLFPVLTALGVRGEDRALTAWFGPRGLSSLLLILLPVFGGVPGAKGWFTITCLVVLVSLVVHGAVIGVFLRRKGNGGASGASRLPLRAREPGDGVQPAAAPETASARPPASAAGADAVLTDVDEKITIQEFQELERRGEPVVIVDARAPRSYAQDALQAADAVRLPPDDPVRAARALRLSTHATLVVYCA
jgi:sodium/hydrogen antiporter